MAKAKRLKENGVDILPVTHENVVFDDNGVSVTEKINELKTNKADKSELFSGDYNDLTNKPEIPSVEGLASEEYVDNMFYSTLGGLKFVKITQESYDALTNKDPNTVYIIVSAENMNNSTGEEGN